MTEELRDRINQFNEIKYGSDDNETRIVICNIKTCGNCDNSLQGIRVVG